MAYAVPTIYGDGSHWTCYLPPFAPLSTPLTKPTINPTPIKTPVPTPKLTPAPTPKIDLRLGGLNLSNYCYSLKQAGAVVVNGIWRCGSSGPTINITSACKWQYEQVLSFGDKNKLIFAKQVIYANPYSWTCYQ